MPDLDRYAKQTSSGEDASGSEFKSFEITDSSSPYPQGHMVCIRTCSTIW